MQKNVRLRQRGDVTVDLTLQVSSLTETVTVVAEAPAGAVQHDQPDDLTRGVRPLQAVADHQPQPGHAGVPRPVGQRRLDPERQLRPLRRQRLRHRRPHDGQNEVLIDGSPLANSSKLGYNPPVDAVAEYTVSQNAVDAEFGHSAGGVITMSMKSGTNTLHGSAYYYGGNADWNAVTNRITGQKSTTRTGTPAARSACRSSRTSCSCSPSSSGRTTPRYVTSTYTLPTALERQGDFSQSYNADGSLRVIYDPLTSRVVNNVIVRDPFPGNRIPADRLDPTAS